MEIKKIILIILGVVACGLCTDGFCQREQAFDFEFEQAFQDASFLYQRGEIDAAIYALQQLEKKYPENSRILFKLSEIAIDQKNWSYAIQVLNKASTLLTNDASLRFTLVDLYSIYQIGIAEIYTEKELVKIQPSNVSAFNRLADLYSKNGMVDEEEWLRRYVLRIKPNSYDNLVKLAVIHQSRQESQDQIQVYEQIEHYFPGKMKDMKKLAYLYSQQQDYFNQERVLTRVLTREPYNFNLMKEWLSVNERNKKKLGLNAFFNSQLGVFTNSSDWYNESDYNFNANFEYPLLASDAALKIDFNTKSQGYMPKKGNLEGQKKVDSQEIVIDFTKYWKRGKTKLNIDVNYINVNVSGLLDVKSGIPLAWVSNELWLEDRKFGGNKLYYGLELSDKILQDLELKIFYNQQPLDNLDALVRLFDKNITGLTGIYTLPDQTTVISQYDLSSVYDGNKINHAIVSVNYPIFVQGQIYDYKHRRIGYISQRPEFYYYIQASMEYYDYDFKSLYYPSFSNEWRFSLNPNLKYKIGADKYLTAGFNYGVGKTLEYRIGASLGFNYFPKEKNLDLNLSISPVSESYLDKTQENVTFSGKSDMNFISFSLLWFF